MNRIELHDLTQEMITGGRKLLQQLGLEGLRPDSMYWEYDEECREWLLQVVIKHMDVEDNFKILRRVFSALDALPEVKELLRPDYFDVRGIVAVHAARPRRGRS